MESLKLEGTTIRGLVKGRPVNCIVRSVPDGLVLPPGQYLLRVGEKNPIYGLFLAVEAHGAPGAAPAWDFFKAPPSALKDTPPSMWKQTTPSALKDSPAAIATLVPANPAFSAIPGAVPGPKLPPNAIRDVGLLGKADAPAAKFYVPGQGMTARVIIAVRPIGQNSLVAQAGFSDLMDAVQQAGAVTLIVP